jgi:hypothetical protein
MLQLVGCNKLERDFCLLPAGLSRRQLETDTQAIRKPGQVEKGDLKYSRAKRWWPHPSSAEMR